MQELNEDIYNESTSDGVVLVDFWAQWCGPCRVVAPIIEELAIEMPDVKFTKFNVDNGTPPIPVKAIPTLALYKDGELLDTVTGALPKQQLKSWISEKISL